MARRFLYLAALAGLLALAASAPAQATIFDRVTFSFEDSSEEVLCGLDVRIDSTVRGLIVLREGQHELDQAFLGHANVRYSDTITNLATGESFTSDGRFREGDVKAVHIAGNIFEFTLVLAGTERVVAGDGSVVLRDSGAIRTTYTFDTLGDDEPGGIFLEGSDRLSGPHPLFEQDEEAFCAMVHELIG